MEPIRGVMIAIGRFYFIEWRIVRLMGSLAVILVIVLAVVVDYFLLDGNRKRWGWMKNWSKLNKSIFFLGFVAVSLFIYLGLSVEYFY